MKRSRLLAPLLALSLGACVEPPTPTAPTMGASPAAPPVAVAVTPPQAAPHRGRCDGPKAGPCLDRYNASGDTPPGAPVTVKDLATAYVNGADLDNETRLALLKALAFSLDADAIPGYVRAFDECTAGRNFDEMRMAALGMMRLLRAETAVADAVLAASVWSCFVSFRPSQNTRSISLVKDLVNAVMALEHPSLGPKAVEKLASPVTDPRDLAQGLDELQFWQATSARVIGDLRYAAGVKPLVKVLLTPTKSDLLFPVRSALTKMPKDAEPVLIAALNGTDPELAALASAYPNKSYLPRVAEPLAYISRPAGRAAILAALEKADTDDNWTMLATDLALFPSDASTVKAFLAAYRKVDPEATVALMGGGNARAILAQAAASFFDPSLTKWLLDENAAAKGDAADAMPPAALPSAIKLMTNASSKAVGNAVRAIPGKAIEKDMYTSALAVLDRCKQDKACYLNALDAPVPPSPPSARMGHVKAAWMAAIYGDAATRASLVTKLASTKDASVRLAIVQAIDHLAPQGDAASADKLDAIVLADQNAGVHAATDELAKTALRLRSRIP